MKLQIVILMCVLSFFAESASAQKKVYKVRIKGNQLITDSAIRTKLKTKRGQVYRKSFVEEDVKNLFKMGYFDNIVVHSQSTDRGLILTYRIEEKPRIDEILYEGNQVFSSKKLKEMSLLKKYEFLNIQKLKKGIKNIENGYKEKGYFLTDVSYKVQNTQSPSKVKLIIRITEHEKTLIKKINFLGNYSISSKKLKSFLVNKEKSILSFLTNSSVYTEDKLMRDQQTIQLLYMEEGFVEMKLIDTHVSLSPNKDGLYISFSISEGEQFKVGQVDYVGDLIFSKVELRRNQALETDEVFVYSKLQNDLKRIQTKYGDKGYAFANVIPQFHTQDGKIHVLFNVQKGSYVHIRRIHISGNHFTQDKVIRRLVTLAEGDLYNASEILKSKNSVQRLGYFEEVDFFNKPVRKQEDLIDLEISVKEREDYGVLQAGAGLSTSSGLTINGKLSRENLFGNGSSLNFQLALLPTQREFFLSSSYLDPYFLDTDWYFGINIFSFLSEGAFWDFMKNSWNLLTPDSQQAVSKDLKKLGLNDSTIDFLNHLSEREFSKNQWGGRITWGRWLTDTTKLLSRFGFESVQFLRVNDEDIFSTKSAEGFRNIVGGSLDYDNRDDRFFPKKGMSSSLSLEYTYQLREQLEPLSFTQMDAWWSYYFNLKTLFSFLPQLFLDWDFLEHTVIKNKIQYGRLSVLSKDEAVPFDKLYLLGGPLNLRGFRTYSVGNRRYSEKIEEISKEIEKANAKIEKTKPQNMISLPLAWRPYGGSQQFFYNLEVRFPLILKAKLFGLAFFDIGNAGDQWEELFSFRKNVGFGFFWVTPFAPISFKWGFPLYPKEDYGESAVEFHLNMGFDF